MSLTEDIQTPVEIKCPVCGRVQVVDLFDWVESFSMYNTWPFSRARHPYTCNDGHDSVEMIQGWKKGENIADSDGVSNS